MGLLRFIISLLFFENLLFREWRRSLLKTMNYMPCFGLQSQRMETGGNPRTIG
jgi:hypothetical protein